MFCSCRLWAKALHVEVEWTVGPLPIDDNKGKEVVLRYASSLDSGFPDRLPSMLFGPTLVWSLCTVRVLSQITTLPCCLPTCIQSIAKLAFSGHSKNSDVFQLMVSWVRAGQLLSLQSHLLILSAADK